MALLEIPISNSDPAFTMTTVLDEQTYLFDFRWNYKIGIWIFDMYDSQENAIFQGKPFQTDVSFLQQYSGETVPEGLLFCVNSNELSVDAERFNISIDVKFYYLEA